MTIVLSDRAADAIADAPTPVQKAFHKQLRFLAEDLSVLSYVVVDDAPCGRGFHERAAPCQVESFFGAFPTANRRPTGGAAGSPLSFLFRKGFCFPPPTRPASIRTLQWSG